MCHWIFAFWNVVQICLGGIRLWGRLSRLRIGLTDFGQGGLPLLVVYGGRSKHYTLIWLVEGEAGARDLLQLMLRGDQHHIRVYPRRWTRRSIIKIIRCMSRRRIRRIILKSLSLTNISLMRISTINMTIIMSSLILSRSSLNSSLRGCRGWCWRKIECVFRIKQRIKIRFSFLGSLRINTWISDSIVTSKCGIWKLSITAKQAAKPLASPHERCSSKTRC